MGNGVFSWTRTFPSNLCYITCSLDGTILAQSVSGIFYAVSSETGSTLASLQLPEASCNHPILFSHQIALLGANSLFMVSLILCPPGTYCVSGTRLTCPAGTYSSAFGSAVCTICPSGTFSETGASNCTLCFAGTFSSAAGSSSCQQCPGGHYCPAGTSSRLRLNCGRGNYCPDSSGAPTPCPYQVPPSGGWGTLQVQGPAFLVETAHCLNHCFWNFTSGDGMLSKC